MTLEQRKRFAKVNGLDMPMEHKKATKKISSRRMKRGSNISNKVEYCRELGKHGKPMPKEFIVPDREKKRVARFAKQLNGEGMYLTSDYYQYNRRR